MRPRMLPTGQEHSYEFLRQRILRGEFKSGSWVNTEQVAKTLGLSRMPVREALRQLAAEGLVTIYPRHGVRVTSLAADEISELFEIRAVLEALAVRRAHPRLTEEDFRKLEELADELGTVEGKQQSWFRCHDAFHDYVCDRSGFPILVNQIRNLRHRVEPYLRLFLKLYDAEMPGSEHASLVAKLRSKSALEAESAMREHVLSAAAAILKFVPPASGTMSLARARNNEHAKNTKKVVVQRVNLAQTRR